MSHWTNIKTQIKDLTALAAAIAELGGTITRGQVERRGIVVEATINFPSCYPVYVSKQADGTYQLSGDSDIFRQRLPGGRVMGQNYAAIAQLYAVHLATQQARRLGHNVARVAGKNGAINLVLTGRM